MLLSAGQLFGRATLAGFRAMVDLPDWENWEKVLKVVKTVFCA
jgi:hypothetical protein